MGRKVLLVLFAVLVVLLSACSSSKPSSNTANQPFGVTSSAFAANQSIPKRNSCEGENLSPPLTWPAPPAATKSFVLILDDPDAVPVVGYVYDHWIVFNIPATTTSLPEGVPTDKRLSDGSQQSPNSAHTVGYSGPCPPNGQTHKYVFTLYAVDSLLDLQSGATKEQIMKAIEGHTLAKAELAGSFTASQ